VVVATAFNPSAREMISDLYKDLMTRFAEAAQDVVYDELGNPIYAISPLLGTLPDPLVRTTTQMGSGLVFCLSKLKSPHVQTLTY
jgi:hypothetical protein